MKPSSLAPATLLVLGSVTGAQTINVEVDYMVGATHSHELLSAEIAALKQMFACHGWTLNIVVDDELPHIDVIQCETPGTGNFFKCTSPTTTTFKELKDGYFDGPSSGWHYAIFGHTYDDGAGATTGGLGEVGGDDFIVAMTSTSSGAGTPFGRAAAFAHELGHNLGLLHHSLSSTVPTGDYAPNYPSVMSYQYAYGLKESLENLGLVGSLHHFKELDYSNGLLPPLPELALQETIGLGIRPVDLNCDGNIVPGTVAADLDVDSGLGCSGGTPIGTLRDYDDWSNIVDSTDDPLTFARDFPDSDCRFTWADPLDGSAIPTLTTEPCVYGLMIWVDPGVSPGGSGTGAFPYHSLPVAVGAATDQSILYLQPGAYTNAVAPLTIGKPLTLTGPGTATIAPQ